MSETLNVQPRYIQSATHDVRPHICVYPTLLRVYPVLTKVVIQQTRLQNAMNLFLIASPFSMLSVIWARAFFHAPTVYFLTVFLCRKTVVFLQPLLWRSCISIDCILGLWFLSNWFRLVKNNKSIIVVVSCLKNYNLYVLPSMLMAYMLANVFPFPCVVMHTDQLTLTLQSILSISIMLQSKNL